MLLAVGSRGLCLFPENNWNGFLGLDIDDDTINSALVAVTFFSIGSTCILHGIMKEMLT